MQKYQREIRQEVLARGIDHIFHFSPDRNATSILTNGLVSRAVLDANDVYYWATDGERYDENLDGVSFTIQSVNQPMFEAKQRLYDGEWIIYAVRASVLWTHKCRFCWTNAASSEIRRQRGFLGGPWAFGQMFADHNMRVRIDGAIQTVSARAHFGREDREATDIQAEVQVLEPISPDLIDGAIVAREDFGHQLDRLAKEIGKEKDIQIQSDLFL